MTLEEIVRLVKEGKFYKSSAWEKKRLEILERDNYECQVCKEEGGFAPATTVHHILHLENRPDLALDDDNLLSVLRCVPQQRASGAVHSPDCAAQEKRVG